jgi:hypothetical protein
MLKDRRVKDAILRPRFWPRYCRLSTAGSKTGNLENLLTRSHRKCDSNCNFRWSNVTHVTGLDPPEGLAVIADPARAEHLKIGWEGKPP